MNHEFHAKEIRFYSLGMGALVRSQQETEGIFRRSDRQVYKCSYLQRHAQGSVRSGRHIDHPGTSRIREQLTVPRP